MARGKNAAALFEVIHAAKQKEQLRATGGGFLTPSWWFKGRAAKQTANSNRAADNGKPENTTAARPASDASAYDPTEGVRASELLRASEPSQAANQPVETEPAFDTALDTGPIAKITPSESAPTFQDLATNEEPAMDDPEPQVAASATRTEGSSAATPASTSVTTSATPRTRSGVARRPLDVGVDRGRQQISFRLTYTSAAISSFGLIVVLGLAFLIGKSWSKGPSPAGASIADLKAKPAFPDVLNITNGNGKTETPAGVGPAPKPLPKPDNKQNVTPAKPADPKATDPKVTEAPKPTGPVNGVNAGGPNVGANGKRIVGMQYVLMQSYPDPEDANDAAKALNDAGIGVTVEKGFWYAPLWSCVVGTRAFDRTKNNPEFTAYMKAVDDVSKSFAGPSKFRRFEPKPLGWK